MFKVGGADVRSWPTAPVPVMDTLFAGETPPSTVSCLSVQLPGLPKGLPLASSAVTRHCQVPVPITFGSAQDVFAVKVVSATVLEPARRRSNREGTEVAAGEPAL